MQKIYASLPITLEFLTMIFFQGSKIRYHCIDEYGTYSEKILSCDSPVQIFPPNTWFAGEVFREKESGKYLLFIDLYNSFL